MRIWTNWSGIGLGEWYGSSSESGVPIVMGIFFWMLTICSVLGQNNELLTAIILPEF